jgi:TRAP-type C4-dicarboxylate transport system substrate-binding protein
MERSLESTGTPPKPIELIFHNIHDHGVEITNLWIGEVERRTRGKVHFTKYDGGGPQFTARADVIRDVPAGGGRYHLLDLIQIPLIFPGSKVGSRVLAQLYAEFPELRAELSDVKIVGLSIGALMAIFSSKAWGPVRTMEDLRGARIRSLLPIDKSIEALGAKPLHVDYLEIARQLADGTLDATVLGLLPAKIFKLAEVGAPYCTLVGDLSITMHPMRTYMKWDSWNKLPPDVQAVIDGLGPAGQDCWLAKHSGIDADSVLREAIDYFQQKGEIIRLSPAEQSRWLEAMQPLRQAAVEIAESHGLPGRRFFARLLELTERFVASGPA